MAAVQLMGEVFKLGDVISGERRKAGYKTAVEFSEAVECKTGLKIPKDTMQRIEAGRQEPKLSQYIAIALTLGKLHDPMLLASIPSAMVEHFSNVAIQEYLKDHPGLDIRGHVKLDSGSTLFMLSDGRKVEVDTLGRQIWEYDSEAKVQGHGMQVF